MESNSNTFALVAFTFVLGYAERMLKKHPYPNRGELKDGEIVAIPLTDEEKANSLHGRLKNAIPMLHWLMEHWNGVDLD